MALHHDLLEQARHLASREPRRPRQASLRRAISSAYYALFHLLADAGASILPGLPIGLRTRARRAFTHRSMQEVCRQFAAGNLNPATAVLLPNPLQPELRRVANAFVELQEARHTADYDLAAVFSRPEVLLKIDLVTRAFDDWRVVRSDLNASVFLAALLLQQHWRYG